MRLRLRPRVRRIRRTRRGSRRHAQVVVYFVSPPRCIVTARRSLFPPSGYLAGSPQIRPPNPPSGHSLSESASHHRAALTSITSKHVNHIATVISSAFGQSHQRHSFTSVNDIQVPRYKHAAHPYLTPPTPQSLLHCRPGYTPHHRRPLRLLPPDDLGKRQLWNAPADLSLPIHTNTAATSLYCRLPCH